MSASQFTIYRSTDASAPALTGTAGSLLTVLDAVLVNGYGSMTAAGWTKPFSNSGNIGCYKNATSGTGMALMVNDNGPGLGTFKESRINGFEVMTSVSTGTGPFPLTPQGVSSAGYVIARKSATLDSVARYWIIMADSHTVYMFALTGDSFTNYFTWGFGDIFSMQGAQDVYRCWITGRFNENQAATNQDGLPQLGALTASSSMNFMPRTFGGVGTSITVSKHGDGFKAGFMAGTVQLEGPDNAIYLSPIWVAETALSCIRGRLRGFYQLCHPIASFADGQTFSGSGDFAGKTFMVIKTSTDNSGNIGQYCMETSATVETN